MHIIRPWKVIKMPRWASDDETSWIRDGPFFWHGNVLVPVSVAAPESPAVEQEVLIAGQ
jgi:hypothetical protein